MFSKFIINTMDSTLHTTDGRLQLGMLVISLAILATSSQHINGKENNQSCSEMLFERNDIPTNFSSSSDCTCEHRTAMICPKLSMKPLKVQYNAFNREVTFTCNKVRRRFEFVIPYVRHYVTIAQPRALHVSMCCSEEIPLDGRNNLTTTLNNSELLSVLHVKDIPNPPTLHKIDLSGNCFKRIEGKFNSSFRKLQELDLCSNFLTHIPNGTFSNMKQLQQLLLAKNTIQNLTRFTFEGLSSLSYLTLESNKIEILQEDVFKELTNLQYLHLGGNKLQTLPAAIFQSNEELRALTLESNSITSLPGSILEPLQNLAFFSVYNNHLESIPVDIFNDLPELSEVRLNRNKLQDVSPDLFATNGILLRIDLSSNNLRQIPKLNFNSFWEKPLEAIIIRNNNITTVTLPFTNYMSKFTEELDISDNCIKAFEHDVKNNTTGSPQFDTGIFRLVCKRCCIDHINPKLLQDIIQSVDLAENEIQKVDMNLLRSITHLESLDLSNNLITAFNVTPEYPLIRDKHKIPYESLNTRITLRNNPINCDCNVMPLLNIIKMNFTRLPSKKLRSNMTFVLRGVSCAEPEILQKHKLWHFLQFPKLTEKLVCNVDNGCPKECYCYTTAVPSATVVNCSNQNFKHFPLLRGIDPPIELHLENNSLIRLPDKNSSLWQKLSGLYLQQNRLTSVENLTIIAGLTKLGLQGNHLSQFDYFMDSLLSHHDISVSLSGNPWECNCKLQQIKTLIVSNGNVDDFNQIACTDPINKRITYLANSTDYELCPVTWNNQILLKALLSSVAAIVVVASLAAVMFFRYKDQIYLWLFKNGYCLGIVTEEDIDYTKLFDAFISCSNKDDQWVASHLLPGLENGTPSYSLCIHSRNWPVGGWIPDQVVHSVQQSRRTIIILTKNFLDSHWSRLEFRTAYEQALNEPAVNRVLIVVPYEVPEVLDPVLSGFIKLNTYIKWDDPHFWRKLRCAMPRIKPNIRKNVSSLYHLTDKFVMLPTIGKDCTLSI